MLLNTISVLLYLASCVFLLRKYKRYSILLGYLFLQQNWSVISCYYNDFGIYNPELFRYTQPSFATSRLVLFYLIFNLGFWLAGLVIANRSLLKVGFTIPVTNPLAALKIATYGLFVIVAAYVANSFATNGILVLNGIYRGEAYKSLDAFGKILHDFGFIFIFTLGFFRKTRKRFQASDAFFILMVLYYMSIGHKFSGLLDLMVNYLTPVWARRIYEDPMASLASRKTFALGLIGVAIVVSVVFTQYNMSTNGSELVLQLFIDRLFAMQGHIWWAVDDQVFTLGHYHHSHWLDELNAILFPGSVPEEAVGMKYLLGNILGWEIASKIFETGYLYTMAYPAILIVTFPYAVGLLIQLAAGAFFFALLFSLYYAINYGYLFRSIVALTVLIPFISTLGSGVLSTFATYGMLVKLSLLGILQSRIFLWALQKRVNAKLPISRLC